MAKGLRIIGRRRSINAGKFSFYYKIAGTANDKIDHFKAFIIQKTGALL